MIVCADDFGLRDDINRATLDLCSIGRLSAVSCMAALGHCNRHTFEPLRGLQDKLDIGLHLCLADETLPRLALTALGSRDAHALSFSSLLRLSLTGRICPAEARGQISAQYELFMEKLGRPPDYLDGHLHAHQLPGIRRGLIDFVLSLPAEQRPYIRNTHQPWRHLYACKLPFFKAMGIGIFGKRSFNELRRLNLLTNDGFAGIYDFRDYRRFCQYLPRFAASLPNSNGILVVHPGISDHWRRQEYFTLFQHSTALGAINRFRPR